MTMDDNQQGKGYSVTWVEIGDNGYTELMPVGEHTNHFMGDECLCGVRTQYATCGACKTNVPIFIHIPIGKIVPETVITMLTAGAQRAIEGGHRDGKTN